MKERRVKPTRRRSTRSGRRSNDPRPDPIRLPEEYGGGKTSVVDALADRIRAIEKILHVQFQRIAELQVTVDRLTMRRGGRRGASNSKRS